MKQSHYMVIAFLLIGAAIGSAAFLQNSSFAPGAVQENDALMQDYSPRAGNPDAKVTIVEFFDPACETCRRFHPFVKRIMDRHDGKVNLVLRYAPLHKGSDKMVAILEASRQQDKFWEVLDLMYDTQPHWAVNHKANPEIFWQYLVDAGFDVARLEKDLKDPAIIKVIQQDIADGQALGATRTPTFFVNGKPMPSFGFEQLRDLVQGEVDANY